MKELRDQIADRCVHFNSRQNKVCEIGVSYDDVTDKRSRPFKYPCLKNTPYTGGYCEYEEFPTKEVINEEVEKIQRYSSNSITLLTAVKEYCKKVESTFGIIKCPVCKEVSLKYGVASNGHVSATCKNCNITIRE